MLTLFRSDITKYSIQYIGHEKVGCRQRRTELVGDVRKKFLLKACALLPGLFQYDRDLPPLGHVLHDDGKAAKRAHMFQQCCDVDIGPELLAVPADAPSLIFRPTCLQSLA